jgi:hypothetical protein
MNKNFKKKNQKILLIKINELWFYFFIFLIIFIFFLNLYENEFPAKFEIKREVANESTDFQFKICSIDKTTGFSRSFEENIAMTIICPRDIDVCV